MKKEWIVGRKEVLKRISDFERRYGFYINPFAFLVNGEVVAHGECEVDVDKQEVHIQYLMSVERKKGYGRLFIDYLFNEAGMKEVWGESTVEAFHFWEKVGATFEKEAEQFFRTNEEKEESVFEEDFLIPFTITA